MSLQPRRLFSEFSLSNKIRWALVFGLIVACAPSQDPVIQALGTVESAQAVRTPQPEQAPRVSEVINDPLNEIHTFPGKCDTEGLEEDGWFGPSGGVGPIKDWMVLAGPISKSPFDIEVSPEEAVISALGGSAIIKSGELALFEFAGGQTLSVLNCDGELWTLDGDPLQ